MLASIGSRKGTNLIPLLGNLSEDAQQLLQAHLKVATLEMKSSVQALAVAALFAVLATIFLTTVYVGSLVTAAYWIEQVHPGATLPYWGTVIAVNLCGALVAGGLARRKGALAGKFPSQSRLSLTRSTQAVHQLL